MRVLCTNGMKSVLLDLVPEFERSTGTKVVIAWGSANGLMKELETGAAGDLAILTAETIDELVKRGKVVPAAVSTSPVPASASRCARAQPSPISDRPTRSSAR